MFSPRINILIWAAFHIIILALFLFAGPLSIETSLYSILPDSNPVKALSDVEEKISDTASSNMTALVGFKDFATAKKISGLFAAELRDIDGIEGIQYEVGTSALSGIQDYLFKYRYHFLSPDVRRLLEEGKGDAVAQRAFMTLSSPVSLGSLDHLDEDPFLLAGDALQYFTGAGILGRTALGVRDSVLTREFQGKNWILISFRSKVSGSSVEMDHNPVPYVLEAAKKLESEYTGAQIVFSGVPIHSYESARKSQWEITIISTISTLFIIALLLLVFRSFSPLLATVAAISAGVLTGLGLTFAVFRNIHIFTIVFGTSLIGISVDYSFHFFSEWAEGIAGRTVARKILPGITIGLVTTLLSYGAFTVSDFPLLQQMALFSIAGLVSTYLTVIFLFSNLKKSSQRTIANVDRAADKIGAAHNWLKSMPAVVRWGIPALFLILSLVGMRDFQLNNNVRDLYKMSDKLFQWEKLSSMILQHGSSGVYLLVQGKNLEDNLEKEEDLSSLMGNLESEGTLGSTLGLTSLIPSRRTQSENLKLVSANLMPLIDNQLLALGFGADTAEKDRKSFQKLENSYIDPADLESLPVNSLTDTLNIGADDGSYYTAILLFGIRDIDRIIEKTKNIPGIYLVNKVDDTSRTLEALSRLALKIIAVSYLLIFFGLIFRYGAKKAGMIVLVPIFASLCTLALLSVLKMPVNLFVVVGLLLIPGMGTDYLILLTESGKFGNRVLLSITLSMMTSVLAFGLLGFTSIAGVFGLTVASGVFITWFFTLLLSRRD